MFSQPQGWFGLREPSRAFSAIVRKDGSTVWAEDSDGKTIASGESGVDDASVIQSAIDTIYNSGGGLIRISSGEYYVGDILLKRRVSIQGEGYSTILCPKDGASTIFKWDSDTMTEASLMIADMLLDGKGNTVDAIWLKGGYWFRFRNLQIYNFKGYGINFGYVWDSDAISCFIDRCGDAANNKAVLAFGTIDNTNGVKLIGVHANGKYANVYLTSNAARIYISNCRFETGDYTPEYILYCADYSYRNFIIGNVFAGNVSSAVVQIGLANTFIGNEVVSTNRATGIKVYRPNVRVIGNFIHNTGDAIWVSGTAEGVIIADNSIYDVQGYGIYFNWQGTPFIVEGNVILNVSGADTIFVNGDNTYTPRGRIANNYIEADPDYAGIRVGGVDEVEISGNNIIGGANSIVVLANSNNINIIGNKVTAPIDMQGTGLIKRNIGYATENSGTATFSGDGTTTQFSIAHGLVSAPTKVLVTPMTADAASDFYVTADDTNIYINYKSAPPSGTDNLKFSWYAEV